MAETTDTSNQPISGLALRLVEIMGAVQRLPKSQRNETQHYNYTPDADVYDFVRQQLVIQKIILLSTMRSYTMTERPTKNGGTMYHVVCDFEFKFVCAETGESETSLWSGEAMDSGDKSISKAVAQATKTFLLKTFLISTGDDPDAHSLGQESNGQKRQPAQKAPPTQSAAPAQPKQQPAQPQAPAANVSTLETPNASGTTIAIDWAVVRAKMRECGWNPDNPKHQETCFPAGTSGMTTADLVEMIAPNPQKKAANQ